MTRLSLTRRHLLRGLGCGLGLPLLEAMLPGAAAARAAHAPKPRIIFCYLPNGKNIFEWVPKERGAAYTLSPTLASLKARRADFTVISGLGHPHSKGGHTGADTWLTGAELARVPGVDYSNSISVDQIIAEQHGKQTRFPSLQLSDESGTGAPFHSYTLSFDQAGTPLPAEESPRRVFERLFVPEAFADRQAALREYAERRSILDSTREEAKILERRLGQADRAKLGEFLASVRATEDRVRRLETWANVPRPKIDPRELKLESQPHNAHDRAMWLDVMLDLAELAFATDTTRVITYQWSREAGGFGGGGESHHDLSHHGGNTGMLARLAEIDRFHVAHLGRFLDRLAAAPDGDGHLLDRTLVLYGCGMNSGADGEHSPEDLPLLLAGGRALGLKHGRHLRFDPKNHPPMSNLLLTLAHKMGVDAARFQDSTGPLRELV